MVDGAERVVLLAIWQYIYTGILIFYTFMTGNVHMFRPSSKINNFIIQNKKYMILIIHVFPISYSLVYYNLMFLTFASCDVNCGIGKIFRMTSSMG